MANILEEGKRGKNLPRLDGGYVVAGANYDLRHSALLYTAQVIKCVGTEPFRTEAFTVQFTEDEVLQITSEWLTAMNRRRNEAKR